MMSNRYATGQSSAIRKSRLEGKPSLLPKPRRPGSTDRLSTEARRPSTTGHRSSSAEPARGTFGARLSREASATKLQLNGRSRSQTGESRYGQATTTPLRTTHYSRPTTTPVRTPSEDRSSRSWQTSLERALAFVTIKDQRPLASAAWQRAECARVSEALCARGAGAGLLRPLTIARFVDVAGALLAAVSRDAKLSSDNYVTKLPHLSKRLLYPGAVSKSWLRTVNTLHAFPHALALIAYLLDLVAHIEMPVLDEWLYVGKDELACLRRDYLYKCWIRFQDPGHQFEDLNEDYLENLKVLLGNDEEKIAELQQVIKKYETCLEDEAERSARADEQRRAARRDALLGALRSARVARREQAERAHEQRALRGQHADAARHLELDVERAAAELERVRAELDAQPLSVAERARLLDDVDYAARVHDSKRALADQIAKMVMTKETELALWQKKTLDSCVEYKQGLIHLSAHLPALAGLAVDEKELMGAECAARLCEAVEALREQAARLSAARADCARARSALARRRALLLEEARTKIAEMKSNVQREQQSLDAELSKESSEAAAWTAEELEVADRLEKLRGCQEEYARVDSELEFWEKQDLEWRTRLAELEQYIANQKIESKRMLESARERRLRLVLDNLALWNEKLGRD
ncbi:caldesmon [Nymphalis io]|uniref:caldesmon n=1 Tax=Inachis io TaxID=171585 RepID=UPI002169517B|nr:caldesmon [Nymphalis io]